MKRSSMARGLVDALMIALLLLLLALMGLSGSAHTRTTNAGSALATSLVAAV